MALATQPGSGRTFKPMYLGKQEDLLDDDTLMETIGKCEFVFVEKVVPVGTEHHNKSRDWSQTSA